MKRALVASTLLFACAGAKAYRTDAPPNVKVVSELEPGVSAALQIYAVDPACTAHDLGALPLDRAALDVGVAAGGPALLVVTFDTSSFLRGSRSTSAQVLFTPRAGVRYELAARYADGMYDVAVREAGRRRELPHRTLAECRGE